jgi:hypothetical protein
MRLVPLHAARAAALALVVIAAGACARAPIATPTPAPARVPAYRTGDDVVAAMHDRYAGRWYRTLTFRQKTSRLLPNGKWDEQTWYEALALPGRLRIDFEPVSAGNGVLYARDSQFVAANGRVVRAEPGINDLLLLGFDVYANPVVRTDSLLRRQGFDLARFHHDTLDGRAMLVVGASAGEMRRKQFWVDAERLVFVRLLEPNPRDSARLQDIRFINYQPRGDAWISPRVEIRDATGKLVFSEDYFDMRTDVPLDESIFDPTPWRNPKNWVK